MRTVYRYSDFWNWSSHRYQPSCPFHLIRYARQHTYRIHDRPSLLTVSFCIIECHGLFCAEAEPPFMKVTTLINLFFPSRVWSALKVIRLFVIQNASAQTFQLKFHFYLYLSLSYNSTIIRYLTKPRSLMKLFTWRWIVSKLQ